jgi:DNA invertase Pin-like site-specific DNA recombinase
MGDGEDRQERDFRAFCERHNLTPVAESFTDRGLSGYKDAHRKKGQLGVLIAMAKAGRFEPGTVIVVEAWDRLGRLRPDKQTKLVGELLETGVRIGICRLEDIFCEEDFGTHKWTTLSVFIQLAFQESKQKADRVAASWASRRKKVREEGGRIRGRLPGWLEADGDGFRVHKANAAAVGRIFALAAAGCGENRIVQQLIREKVPPIGKVIVRPGRTRGVFSGKWQCPYVNKLLNDRRVLGEYQPRTADRKPAGPMIPDYYPRIISDKQWLLARAGRERRRCDAAPRQRKYTNLLKGLLMHASDGEPFLLHNRGTGAAPNLVYMNSAGRQGRATCVTFPAAVLQDAVLSLLEELTAADVLPASAPSRAGDLRQELGTVRGHIEQVQADVKKRGYNPHILDIIRDLTAREESLASQLQEEMARTARPAERSLNELPSLIELRRKAADRDSVDLQVAAALRNIIDEAWLLIVPKGSFRVAVLQLFFTGGRRRDYLILHQTAGNHRQGGWRAFSFAEPAGCGLDLRTKPASLPDAPDDWVGWCWRILADDVTHASSDGSPGPLPGEARALFLDAFKGPYSPHKGE